MRFIWPAAFFAGFGVAASAIGCNREWGRPNVAAPAIASPAPGRWQQYCTYAPGSGLDEYNAYLEGQGEAGWELVSGSPGGFYCFKSTLH